jgi:hypothetical protein
MKTIKRDDTTDMSLLCFIFLTVLWINACQLSDIEEKVRF